MSFQVEIESLAFGGKGVGRHEGKVVFVEGAAPGDRLECRVVREKKRFCEAEIVRIVEPSSQRCEAPCPVYEQCGGCQWQHLPYEVQCQWKEQTFRETLVRIAGVDGDLVHSLVPSVDCFGYRSRMQFKCYCTDKGFVMGFYRKGSHYVIDAPQCLVAEPAINEALGQLRQWLGMSFCPDKIPQVDISVGSDGKVRCVVHYIGDRVRDLVTYLRPLGGGSGLALFLQTGRKSTLRYICGDEDLTISVDSPPLSLSYGPGGFAQVNLAQNRALVDEVVAQARLAGDERVLDLFCGMGNFTLPLARRAKHVVGVEDFALSIEKGKENARANGIENVSFHAEDAAWAFRRFLGGEVFDVVVLDPPRAGAGSAIKDIVASGARRIVYVSCDPATLARDLKNLTFCGYRVVGSRPFDLFPQTYHIESVTVLEK